MKVKTCAAFKVATDTADAGAFEAIVSVFGNVDFHGDVVMPGAFADSLADWKASGDPIPVLWSHRMDDPRYSIGAVKEAAELDPGDPRIPDWADQWVKDHGGLWVAGRLHTGPEAGEIAKAARALLKQRLVKQFSYAYEVKEGGWAERDGVDVYELRKLHLFEVSPTQIGANELTELAGAKAVDLDRIEHFVKSLSAADREALTALGRLAAGKAAAEPDDEQPPTGEPVPPGLPVPEPAPGSGDESQRLSATAYAAYAESAAALAA